MFQNWLISNNIHSGKRAWWLLWLLGLILAAVWVVVALPFVGNVVGVNSLGAYVGGDLPSGFLVYGRLTLSSAAYDYYFLAILFGIAILKIGLLCMQVGGAFAKGYIYVIVRGVGEFIPRRT